MMVWNGMLSFPMKYTLLVLGSFQNSSNSSGFPCLSAHSFTADT